MKKLICVFSLAIFIFVSCKKDRVCNCTVTEYGRNSVHTVTPGIPPLVPATDTTIVTPIGSVNTSKKTYTRVSKKAMRANCFNKAEETSTESTDNSVPGLFMVTTVRSVTTSYSCKIE